LTNRLVLENLKYRPIRTLLGLIAIGIQVTMVLTLVGLSEGLLQDQKLRARGVGADIVVRPSGSSIIGFNANMPAGILGLVQKQPHVTLATGVLIQPIGGVNSVTGIDLPRFLQLGGTFRFVRGGPFQAPYDIIVDEYHADQHKLHVNDSVRILNRPWRVSGIVEPGVLSRQFVQLSVLQDLSANTGKLSAIYVKLDDPSRTGEVIAALKSKLGDYPIYSMDELADLYSIGNVPMLSAFIGVVIGLGVLVGFLVVFLSMYTAVLERTRQIGVLKALGASPGFIIGSLMRETTLLALAGSVVGILLSFLTRWVIRSLVPGSLIQAIVPIWWPIVTAIALAGALLGTVYPGLKAARQDVIEALAYE
jgi:putative ABC transport system permease protein